MLLLFLGTSLSLDVVTATYAPNYFLGTCLTKSWVSAMEDELGASSTARDADGRLAYPFLQPALQHRRHTVSLLSHAHPQSAD